MTSIIVITTDSLWSAIGDSLTNALEPRIFTVRNERTFEVTQVSPLNEQWSELRGFRNVLAIGTAQDGWISPVLKAANVTDPPLPSLVRARNVWARNQFVTALVLPAENSASAALSLTRQVAAAIDTLFRAYARERMFASQADSVLRDSLRAAANVSVLLPTVYESVKREPDLLLFQNSTQIGGDLVRSILISARPGLLEPTAETALAWRDSIAAVAYRPPQTTLREHVETRSLTLSGQSTIETQGAWEGNDPSWPMGGPFIARMVQCPTQNRTFLVDGWFYAPSGQRGTRYEYIVQLQTILDSFECAG